MFLTLVAVLALAGLAFWGILRLIAATPSLLIDVKPCRGHWAEARIRKCDQGLEATGIPVEPYNAFSNLAYLAAAVWLLEVLDGWPRATLAGALILLAVGSTLYHGTKAMWAARLDHSGMYAVFGTLAVYAVVPPHPAAPYVVLAGALAAAIGFAFVAPGDVNARLALLLALVAIRCYLLDEIKLTTISLLMFAVAFIVWHVDRRTLVLGRFGHAIWHVLTAGAITAMFFALSQQ